MKNFEKKNKLRKIEMGIKKDFRFLRDIKDVDAVLLYGSYAKGEETIRSDIDVCVVAPSLKTPKEFSRLLLKIWGKINANKYDVRIFEELPLYIKIDIINNNRVIFSKKGVPELSYYFYHYRKIWNDQSVNWFEKK